MAPRYFPWGCQLLWQGSVAGAVASKTSQNTWCEPDRESSEPEARAWKHGGVQVCAWSQTHTWTQSVSPSRSFHGNACSASRTMSRGWLPDTREALGIRSVVPCNYCQEGGPGRRPGKYYLLCVGTSLGPVGLLMTGITEMSWVHSLPI